MTTVLSCHSPITRTIAYFRRVKSNTQLAQELKELPAAILESIKPLNSGLRKSLWVSLIRCSIVASAKQEMIGIVYVHLDYQLGGVILCMGNQLRHICRSFI